MIKEILHEFRNQITIAIVTILMLCTGHIIENTWEYFKSRNNGVGKGDIQVENFTKASPVYIDKLKENESKLESIINEHNEYNIRWISLKVTNDEHKDNDKIKTLEKIINEVQIYAENNEKDCFKDAKVDSSNEGFFTILVEKNDNISLEDIKDIEDKYREFMDEIKQKTSIYEGNSIVKNEEEKEEDYPIVYVNNIYIEGEIEDIKSHISDEKFNEIELDTYQLLEYITQNDMSKTYLNKYINDNEDIFGDNLEMINYFDNGDFELNPEKSYLRDEIQKNNVIEAIKNAKYEDSEVTINGKVEANKIGENSSDYKYTWDAKKIDDDTYVVWCKQTNMETNKYTYIDIYEYDCKNNSIIPITQNKEIVNKDLDTKYREAGILGN